MTKKTGTIFLFVILSILAITASVWFGYALYLNRTVQAEPVTENGNRLLSSASEQEDPLNGEQLNSKLKSEIMTDDLGEVNDMTYINETLFIGHKDGAITLYNLSSNTATTLKKTDDLLTNEGGELISLTPDPEWKTTNTIFTLTTQKENNNNKTTLKAFRLTFKGNEVEEKKEILREVFPENNITGLIRSDQRGFIWLALGSEQNPGLAQDPRNPAGKVMRLGADGSIPANNPNPGSAIYSLGHYQPKELIWVGQNDQPLLLESRNGIPDRINQIKPNSNYGWPISVDCNPERENFKPPCWCDDTGKLNLVGLTTGNKNDTLLNNLVSISSTTNDLIIWDENSNLLKKIKIEVDDQINFQGPIVSTRKGKVYTLISDNNKNKLLQIKF